MHTTTDKERETVPRAKYYQLLLDFPIPEFQPLKEFETNNCRLLNQHIDQILKIHHGLKDPTLIYFTGEIIKGLNLAVSWVYNWKLPKNPLQITTKELIKNCSALILTMDLLLKYNPTWSNVINPLKTDLKKFLKDYNILFTHLYEDILDELT